MKVNPGVYGKDTQVSNSLYAALLKYPEIGKTLILQDKKYTVTYLTEALSSVKEMGIGDKKYQWFVKGRRQEPSTCTGTYSGDGSSGQVFTVETYENFINPNDLVIFYSGAQAIALDGGTPSANGTTYKFRLNVSASGTWDGTVDGTIGKTIGQLSTTFGEGSERGFGSQKYPDTFVNYLSTSRKSLEITGDYLTDVTWISNNGQSLWFFTHQKDTEDQFNWEREGKLKYGRSNVDPITGNVYVKDLFGKDLPQGDGYVAQIDSINIDTYSGTLAERRFTDFIYQYKDQAGLTDGESIAVHTGIGGYKMFEYALKDYYIPNGVLKQDITGGAKIPLGNDYVEYHVAGLRLYLVHDSLKDDRQLFSNLNTDGFTKESYGYDFMNLGTNNGVPNVQRMVKSAGSVNRGMIVKYIPGMVNPFAQNELITSTSNDSFRMEWLSQEMIVVNDPKSCARLLLA